MTHAGKTVSRALVVAMLIAPAGAEQVCLTKKQARHLWPRQHLYWYSGNHCWSNRHGPPRGIKVDPPIIPDHAMARAPEPTVTETVIETIKTWRERWLETLGAWQR